MSRTYARFAATPIGPNLAARDGGLTLTTTVASSSMQSARTDVAMDSGTHGFECVFWGDNALTAGMGFCLEGHSMSVHPGGDNTSVGWVFTGSLNEIRINGTAVDGGEDMPAPVKGDILGVRLTIGAPNVFEAYLNGNLVRSVEFTKAGPFYGCAGLRSTDVGMLVCALNAGQWGFRSPAAQSGWYSDDVIPGSARLSDEDFISGTGDSTPNAQYLGIIQDGLTLTTAIDFWAWDGSQQQAAAATLRVSDADGALDALALADVRGVPVAIRQGAQGGSLDAAAPIARFVVSGLVIEDDGNKTLTLADAHSDLDTQLARQVFLPNIPALAWKPQPVVIGAVCGIPAQVVNSDGTALWLCDAPLAALGDVMDRGDIMEAGTYALAPNNQQLNMQSPPVGPVVVDGSSIGSDANGLMPATLQQALMAIFARIDKTAWSAVDAAAIDAATGYAGIGYFANDTTTVRSGLQAILPSYGAWYWQDETGVLRFSRVITPESYVGDLAFDLGDALLADDVVATPDRAPNLSRRMAFQPNAQVLGASDLVTDIVDVPQARRDALTAAWRGQVYSAAKLAPRYNFADFAAPMVSCFYRQVDAQAELDRVLAMYAQPRMFYQLAWRSDDAPPAPGSVGRLTYPRYALDAGKQLLVRRVDRQPSTGDITLYLWG